MLSRFLCWFRGHDWTELPLKLHWVGFPARLCERCGAHEPERPVYSYSDLSRRP